MIHAMPCADFDLEAVRAKLDEQGMAIAANQEASIKSRRKLADVTKSAPVVRTWWWFGVHMGRQGTDRAQGHQAMSSVSL